VSAYQKESPGYGFFFCSPSLKNAAFAFFGEGAGG
jgi:hypothetical protein